MNAINNLLQATLCRFNLHRGIKSSTPNPYRTFMTVGSLNN